MVPCTDYFFRVVASEDLKGIREDFKVFSEVVGYQNQYTPKFIKPPIVKERRRRRDRKPQRRKRVRKSITTSTPGFEKLSTALPQGDQQEVIESTVSSAPVQATPEPTVSSAPVQVTAEPEIYPIKVRWRLSDIDYPVCLDYFVLDYYDTSYNESSFQRTFMRPFQKTRLVL